MATVNPTFTYHGEHTVVATWASFANGDTLVPVGPRFADYSDRTVQFSGSFGGTVTLEGSCDGSNYLTLTDPQGNAISKAAAAIEGVLEAPLFLRPTAGASVTATNCILVMRRGRGGKEV